MFFSVPYSEGFTATVNGKPVDVDRVNYGFTGIRIPADKHVKIEFTIKLPDWSRALLSVFGARRLHAVYDRRDPVQSPEKKTVQ